MSDGGKEICTRERRTQIGNEEQDPITLSPPYTDYMRTRTETATHCNREPGVVRAAREHGRLGRMLRMLSLSPKGNSHFPQIWPACAGFGGSGDSCQVHTEMSR